MNESLHLRSEESVFSQPIYFRWVSIYLSLYCIEGNILQCVLGLQYSCLVSYLVLIGGKHY